MVTTDWRAIQQAALAESRRLRDELPPVEPRQRRMAGWWIPASCGHCGGAFEHVADGRPTRTEARIVARCIDCAREWVLAVHLVAAVTHVRHAPDQPPDRPDRVHGTRGGYTRGCHCNDCRQADADYRRRRRARRTA